MILPHKDFIENLHTLIYERRWKFNHQRTTGYVYLITELNHGYTKIGKTNNVADRMRTFGVKLPFMIEIRLLIVSDRIGLLEQMLHRQFEDKHIQGEWFNLSDDDFEYIKSLGTVQAIDDDGRLFGIDYAFAKSLLSLLDD